MTNSDMLQLMCALGLAWACVTLATDYVTQERFVLAASMVLLAVWTFAALLVFS